jgi:nucleotide-binding universal stress UspA family protein
LTLLKSTIEAKKASLFREVNMRIKKILYPTDYSACSHQAFLQAVEMAVEHEADEVHIVYVEDDPNLNEDQRQTEVKKLHERLEALETEMNERKPGLLKWPCFRAGFATGLSVGEALVDYARKHDIDLVVMGTHGRTGLRRILMGSVAEHVVRHAPCSVMTVHGLEGETKPRRVRRIVVPVDFSGHSCEIVQHARSLADVSRTEVDLIHIVEDIVFPSIYGIDPITLASPSVRDSMRAKLVRLADECGLTRYCAHVRAGNAWKEIIEFAEMREADMVVIGSRGLSGLERMFLGSVAENVLRRASCPVFVVRNIKGTAIDEEGRWTHTERKINPMTAAPESKPAADPPEMYSGYL